MILVGVAINMSEGDRITAPSPLTVITLAANDRDNTGRGRVDALRCTDNNDVPTTIPLQRLYNIMQGIDQIVWFDKPAQIGRRRWCTPDQMHDVLSYVLAAANNGQDESRTDSYWR